MFEGIKATILDRLRPVSPEQIWKEYYEEGLGARKASVEFERETASRHSIEELEEIIKANNPDITEEQLLSYLERWKEFKSRSDQDWEMELERVVQEWGEEFEAFKNSEEGQEYLKFKQQSYRYEKAMQDKFERKYHDETKTK